MSPDYPEWELWHTAEVEPPISERAIYAIFARFHDSKRYILMYIGSTGNMKQRYERHEVIRELKFHELDVSVKYLYVNDPDEWEFDFIGRQRPLMNKRLKYG